ncbi:hypothetical protein DVH05_009617 [Phytophthora capsici]|nr:hypothetical protein DVH05_012715 [Phytophthora capsici]KAG1702666.1 hypothetical protein DVH05_009617 [Phytophthora capsici]
MAVCIPDTSENASAGSSMDSTRDNTNLIGRRLLAAVSSGSGSSDGYVQLETEFSGAVGISTVVNALSLLGFAFILATYLLFPPVRKQHSSLLVWVVLMGMLFHGTVLAQMSATFGTYSGAAVA